MNQLFGHFDQYKGLVEQVYWFAKNDGAWMAVSKEKKFENWNRVANIAKKVENKQKKIAEAEKIIIKKWNEPARYLIKGKPYNIMGKIWTLEKNENLLDQMQVFLHSVIIARIKRFKDLNVVINVYS